MLMNGSCFSFGASEMTLGSLSTARRGFWGLRPLMTALAEPGPAADAQNALQEFERLQCPGVPTVVVNGQRFFGKDRVDWAVEACRVLISGPA